MRPRSRPASLALPIVNGIVLMLVTLVLTVLYNLALVTDWFRGRPPVAPAWMPTMVLVAGWLMGLAVIVGLIVFVVTLARQIRLNQRQQNFIDSVTHELKSPLTSLKLHLETIQRRPLSEEQLAGFTSTMLADVERLDQLIDHVLEAARAESIRRPLRRERIDLKGRVETVARLVEGRHGLPAGTIVVRGTVPPLPTDPSALDLVLTNLLDNAVKYSLDEVSVTVSLTPVAGGGASIAVADAGVGIPKGHVRRIFHRFHRVGNELTRIRQGTGLGLYIVKETVRQLGGAIRVDSPGEHQGSVFTLTLPGSGHG
ncbi:MAG: HAMP domain-containing sensor histidine kinase [Candidatus Sericytochromatia bacterium]|nr:HAMP domain-containing sensor histidine kinase [Candidatus Sericytochromatia bacterium]